MIGITANPFSRTTIKDEACDSFSFPYKHNNKTSEISSKDVIKNDLSFNSYHSHKSLIEDKPKVNLLKLLKSSKKNAKLFKPIGNQIVVPLQLPIKRNKKNIFSECNGILSTSKKIPFCQRTNLLNNKKDDKQYDLLNHSTTFPLETNKPVFQFTLEKKKIKLEKDNEKNECKAEINPEFVHYYDATNLKSAVTDSNVTDNSLTSLSWLSNKDSSLLQIIRKCNPDDPIAVINDDNNENSINHKRNVSSIFTALSQIYKESSFQSQVTESKDTRSNKPPYSFSCLIFMAIEDSDMKRLKVKDIYKWIDKQYPYFCVASPSWKNSIRHNLSLSRCFMKANPEKDSPKNSFWCINPSYRPNLIESLKRSYYLHSHDRDTKEPLILKELISLPYAANVARCFDVDLLKTVCYRSTERLLPFWKPATKDGADSDTTDAALNLIGLSSKGLICKAESINNTLDEIFRVVYFRNGYADKFDDEKCDERIVVIRDPAEDHCYCASPREKKARSESPDSEKSAPDAAYEFESTIFSDDELDADVVEDIMEEIMVGTEEENPSLFDSGFGSMKNFDLCGDKQKNAKKSRKSKVDVAWKTLPAKRSSSSSSSKKEKMSRLNNSKSSTSSTRAEKANSKKKHPTAVLKRKSKKRWKKRRNSANESGKDSPKTTRRTNRKCARRFNDARASKKSETCAKQAVEAPRSFSLRKRRLSMRNRNDCVADDEEEIKLAAGSLLRLAGLIKPTS